MGDQIDYGMRVYDPRAGRFLSEDPLREKYPWYTPYLYAGNKPISDGDLDGLEDWMKTQNLLVRDKSIYNLTNAAHEREKTLNAASAAMIKSSTISQGVAPSRRDFERRDEEAYFKTLNENLSASAAADPFGSSVGRMLVTTPTAYIDQGIQHINGIKEGFEIGNKTEIALNTFGLVLDVLPFSSLKGVAFGISNVTVDDIFSTSISTRGLAERFALKTEYRGFLNANEIIKSANPVFDLFDKAGNVVDVTTTSAKTLSPSQFYKKLNNLGGLDPNAYANRTLQIYVKDGQYSAEQIGKLTGQLKDYLKDFQITNTNFKVTAIK